MPIKVQAAQRLAAAMNPWAKAMMKHLKRFDLDTGVSGMASEGAEIDGHAADNIIDALTGVYKKKIVGDKYYFYSDIDPKHGICVETPDNDDPDADSVVYFF